MEWNSSRKKQLFVQFPFGLLSSDDINNMNSSNYMHKLDMIPEFEITSTITNINDTCSNDIDNYG